MLHSDHTSVRSMAIFFDFFEKPIVMNLYFHYSNTCLGRFYDLCSYLSLHFLFIFSTREQ